MNKQKTPPETKRCAIYTRKSTDEGLDSEFSTLDNQRLAAENYIASQVGEGWTALPERYDDGGFTGGNMERPALQRLLADVEAGKVDCIVVYKVDRLSRSLLDFAKIIDILNNANCSFVAVTQHFSTADSLGRLTLNILLSFAQFERELIAERTRDKMSAARKQGRWTGGMLFLGYDLDPSGSRLLVNETEAEAVREYYRLYLEQESLMAVVKILRERGVTNKTWTTKNGKIRKGRPFNKTTLLSLLTNVAYIGKVSHHGEVFDGKQEPIVDENLWNRVQRLLKHNRNKSGSHVRNKYNALLKGLMHCGSCQAAMIHAVTRKKKKAKAYRYYVCTHAQKNGWDSCPGPSIPAEEIEAYVVNQIRDIGKDEALAQKTFEAATATARSEMEKLENEETLLLGHLKANSSELQDLVGNSRRKPKGLLDLQDTIAELEQKITGVREQKANLDRALVDKADVSQALALFDPVWKELTANEQAKALRILIERIVYDSEKGSVSITFRDTGIKDLLDNIITDQEETHVE